MSKAKKPQKGSKKADPFEALSGFKPGKVPKMSPMEAKLLQKEMELKEIHDRELKQLQMMTELRFREHEERSKELMMRHEEDRRHLMERAELRVRESEERIKGLEMENRALLRSIGRLETERAQAEEKHQEARYSDTSAFKELEKWRNEQVACLKEFMDKIADVVTGTKVDDGDQKTP